MAAMPPTSRGVRDQAQHLVKAGLGGAVGGDGSRILGCGLRHGSSDKPIAKQPGQFATWASTGLANSDQEAQSRPTAAGSHGSVGLLAAVTINQT